LGVIAAVGTVLAALRMSKGYVIAGVTNEILWEVLRHSLEKLNLSYRETPFGFALIHSGANLHISKSSIDPQIWMENSRDNEALHDIVACMKSCFAESDISVDRRSVIFFSVVGIFTLMLSTWLFWIRYA
jgi:hypothetical protein